MFDKAVTRESIWDFIGSQTIAGEQRWVLSAIQKYGQELITMLWRILGNEQDVCDAYQDTFLQLAHFEGGMKPSNIKAYLFSTANNVAISMLRRKIAERNRIKRTATETIEDNSPIKELDSKFLQEILRESIAKLPEHLRSVLVMRDLAELSYNQISSILKISKGTARVYRCKAIQLLAVWMSKEE
ncbi:MAG: sigma-70 family RNA polymerase sigma factor [Sedimentisphaerales bacterium]|nr:sigma-70 family RNA polymerase sigma factor [Sedimentisphaerales bacterium]